MRAYRNEEVVTMLIPLLIIVALYVQSHSKAIALTRWTASIFSSINPCNAGILLLQPKIFVISAQVMQYWLHTKKANRYNNWFSAHRDCFVCVHILLFRWCRFVRNTRKKNQCNSYMGWMSYFSYICSCFFCFCLWLCCNCSSLIAIEYGYETHCIWWSHKILN